MPYECNAGLSNSCPTNFECTYDQLSGNSVCCGATSMGVFLFVDIIYSVSLFVCML